MTDKIRKSWLRRAFETAVYSGVVASAALFATPIDAGDQANKDAAAAKATGTSHTTKASNTYQSLWEEMLRRDVVPYQNDTSKEVVPYGNPDVTVVMVETSFPDLESLTLMMSDYSLEGPEFLDITRHGEAGALIIQRAVAGDKVNVHYIEKDTYLEDWIYDVELDETRAIFMNADLVSLSMGWPTKGDQQKRYSAGDIDSGKEIRLSDDFWKKSRTIFVKSAGNYADEYNDMIERSNAHHTMRADTYLPVGEVRWDKDGSYVVDYSSRVSSIAFVTTNPYYTGFSSRYVRNEADFHRDLDAFYTQPMRFGMPLTAKDMFMTMLRILPDDLLEERLQTCHPDFGDVDFDGKEDLEKDSAWIRKNPEKVFEAFKNGVVANMVVQAEAKLERYKDKDQLVGADLVKHLNGTSFSAPQGSAIIAKGLVSAYGTGLTEYDVTAAALLAAEPIHDVEIGTKDGDPVLGKLRYVDNGSRIPFNSSSAGYGELTEENMLRVIERMKIMLRQDPSLQTEHRVIDTGMVRFDQDKDGHSPSPNYRDYKITVPDGDDIQALSTHLVLDFDCANKDIPLKLTLISPSGGHVNLSPSRLRESSDGMQRLSITREIGHFGNDTAGEWTLRLHHGAHDIKIDRAQLTVKGMEKGNVVDEYIRLYGGSVPAESLKELEDEYRAVGGGAGLDTESSDDLEKSSQNQEPSDKTPPEDRVMKENGIRENSLPRVPPHVVPHLAP